MSVTDDSMARPIAFASKSLTWSQKNYPAHRLEFLALKWSVCDKFSHWFKGHDFTVWVDKNPQTLNLNLAVGAAMGVKISQLQL